MIVTLKKEKFAEQIGDPRNWNKYAYVKNNPLVYVDPTGKLAIGANHPADKELVELKRKYDSAHGLAKIWVGVRLALASTNVLPTPLAIVVEGAAIARAGAAAGRAGELANAMGKTKDFVTIAVTETKEGVRLISSSEKALRLSVSTLLKEGEDAMEGIRHAEVTGVNAAMQMGLTPTGAAASRGICPSCVHFLNDIAIH